MESTLRCPAVAYFGYGVQDEGYVQWCIITMVVITIITISLVVVTTSVTVIIPTTTSTTS